MGDRGNIVIRQEANTNRGDVWFYGHWSGYRLKDIVQTALARNERWSDESYLARIVFDALTGKDTGTTSFGISTRLQDNEYPILVVDCPAQTVSEIPQSVVDNNDGRLPDKTSPPKTWSFEEFAARPKETVTA